MGNPVGRPGNRACRTHGFEHRTLVSCGGRLKVRCMVCMREATNRYRQRHAEKVRANAKRYRDENRERIRAWDRAWLEANIEKKRASWREAARRARAKAAVAKAAKALVLANAPALAEAVA